MKRNWLCNKLKIGNSFWYMTPVSETDRPILGMVVGQEKR